MNAAFSVEKGSTGLAFTTRDRVSAAEVSASCSLCVLSVCPTHRFDHSDPRSQETLRHPKELVCTACGTAEQAERSKMKRKGERKRTSITHVHANKASLIRLRAPSCLGSLWKCDPSLDHTPACTMYVCLCFSQSWCHKQEFPLIPAGSNIDVFRRGKHVKLVGIVT